MPTEHCRWRRRDGFGGHSSYSGDQITLRNNRRLQAAMRSTRLAAIETLSDFDFSFQPSINR